MKNLITLFVLILLSTVSFCQSSSSFFENVAIMDLSAQKNSDGTFNYVIKLQDFSGRTQLPVGFGMKGYTFADDGRGMDQKAGDGLYTAKEKRSLSVLQDYPITETVYYDSAFSHAHQLVNANGQRIGISCTFVQCGCPCSNGNTCLACTEFGWQCWMVKSCKVDLGLF